MSDGFYLSFDCATKTLAFSLCWVGLGAFRARHAGIRAEAAAGRESFAKLSALARRPLGPAEAEAVRAGAERLREKTAGLAAEVAGACRLLDGETVDLFPGRADSDISTVERIRALAAYVASRVRPSLRRHGADRGLATGLATGLAPTGLAPTGLAPTGLAPTGLAPTAEAGAAVQQDCAAVQQDCAAVQQDCDTMEVGAAVQQDCAAATTVLIEFQMGPNARARAIAAALTALFVDFQIAFVGPTLKNKIAFASSTEWYRFAEKYATTYGANKAHAKANLAEFERLFGSGVAPSSAALRGHIADSFLQVLGYIVHGTEITAAAAMF